MAETTSERPSRTSRNIQPPVIPDATRPDVFGFIERLFFGVEDRPEKIELRQAFGQGCRKHSEEVIFQREFKANASKPTREQCVAFANEFVALAQSNCNEIGRAHKYAILALNKSKSAAPYNVMIIACAPKHPAHYDPTHANDDDEEDVTSDIKRRDMLMAQMMEHTKSNDEHSRWQQEQFSTSMAHLLERCENIIDKLLHDKAVLESSRTTMIQAYEESLSKKQERDIVYENHKFKMEGMKHAGKFLASMFPVIVNKITNQKTLPTTNSAIAEGCGQFLDSLTEDQKVKLFGPITGTSTPAGGGIIRPEQAIVFGEVADRVKPESHIKQLLPGGAMEITADQMQAVQTVLSPEQFMPLVALFMGSTDSEPEALDTEKSE